MFYIYRQNNSGGFFQFPAVTVIVEADSTGKADEIAIDNGLYFDVDYEIDCDCCGMRWYKARNEEGNVFESLEDALSYVSESDVSSFAELDGVEELKVVAYA